MLMNKTKAASIVSLATSLLPIAVGISCLRVLDANPYDRWIFTIIPLIAIAIYSIVLSKTQTGKLDLPYSFLAIAIAALFLIMGMKGSP